MNNSNEKQTTKRHKKDEQIQQHQQQPTTRRIPTTQDIETDLEVNENYWERPPEMKVSNNNKVRDTTTTNTSHQMLYNLL